MSQRAYAAVYDHGQLIWEDKPPPQQRARVLVFILPEDHEGIQDHERFEWLTASMTWLGSQYSDDEYEYRIPGR